MLVGMERDKGYISRCIAREMMTGLAATQTFGSASRRLSRPARRGALKTARCKKIASQPYFCFPYLRLSSKLEPRYKKQKDVFRHLLASFGFVGMTGFEPATTRPPDVYSNRAELHPEVHIKRKPLIWDCKYSVDFS